MVADQTYREIVVFFAPQSETMDGGAFANGRMDAPLSDKEQIIRLFPMHCTKRPAPVTRNSICGRTSGTNTILPEIFICEHPGKNP